MQFLERERNLTQPIIDLYLSPVKHFAAEIAPILTVIFQDSIDNVTVSHRWKEANVCATFKKGKKSDPANYRPISLTCQTFCCRNRSNFNSHLSQDSIDSVTVSHRWKEANVCATFKKGKKSDPANYRPISLTCIASKILEHIVHSFIMKHLNDHNILTDCQHGLRAKRSTEMQLILTLHDMAKTIQSSSIHEVVLDFAKAFDKVPHRRLLRKL